MFQLVHPDLPADFPDLRSLDARPHNLPLRPTPFLGREREVGEIVDRLGRPDVRLLTLTGPGGTGKTRLALQAAAEVLDEFADGVYFVPLALVTDPTLVPSMIASALGIRKVAEQSVIDRLRDVLTPQRLLLVLDNVEHLVEVSSFVGDLLGTAPGLKILATSRVPLRLRADREYPVPALTLPNRKSPPPPEELSQYEAVRLFIDRAQAVKPDFTIDSENAPAVAEICWRLDGLPLAIELAAARVRLLPSQAMLARLDKRLAMLTSGARDAPARQRTLRDTIAWSHDPLHPDDHILLRRLAVFARGCTLEAAEAVANHDLGLDVLSGMEPLCEQSLLRQEGHGAEPRFTMLETIREFALGQLAASGEERSVRDAHVGAMVALAEAAAPHLEGPDQGAWAIRLEADHANVREVIGWLRTQSRIEEVLRLGASIKWFWCLFHAAEAGPWLEEALAQQRDVPRSLRADGLFAAGHLQRFRGDTRRAVALHEEELALRREAGDESGLGRVLLSLGIEAVELGNPSAADSYVLEALDRLRAADDRWGVGIALTVLGQQARAAGNFAAAAERVEDAAQTHRSTGDAYHVVLSLSTLALVVIRLGDLERAQEHGLAALATAEEAGLAHTLLVSLGTLAEIALARADLDAAEGFMQRALEAAQAIGDEAEAASFAAYLASLDHRQGNDRAAADHLRNALETIRRHGDLRATAMGLEVVDVIAADRGMMRPAARLFGAAVTANPGIALDRFPSEESAHERATAAARAMLGEPAFSAAHESGRDLSPNAAVAEALAVVEELAHAEDPVNPLDSAGETS